MKHKIGQIRFRRREIHLVATPGPGTPRPVLPRQRHGQLRNPDVRYISRSGDLTATPNLRMRCIYALP